MKHKTNIYEFFQFKKVFGLPPLVQVMLVVGLFMTHSYLTHLFYGTEGITANGREIDGMGVFLPIYEELIFRGIILAVLLRTFKPVKALFISAALFGLYHFQNVIGWGLVPELFIQMGYTFVLGLFLAWLTIRTKTLWPAVIIHYINNILTTFSIISLSAPGGVL